jgi:signal transduction histidine kinase
MVKFLTNLVDVPSTDPDEARRRRLLNILVLGIGTLCLIGVVIAVVNKLIGLGGGRGIGIDEAIMGGTAMLASLVVIFFINRYGSAILASTLFLTIFTIVLIFGDAPEHVVNGRALVLFALPILMASVLLRSYASFFAATFVSAALAVFARLQGMPVNPFISIGFYALALVSWLASSGLEQALRDLRRTNQELDRQMVERQRLASEIHDSLAQGFASVVMHLEAAEPHVPAGATDAQRHLELARYVARDSLVEARRLVRTLQPKQLEEAALPHIIQRVASRWSQASEIPTTTTITGADQRLNPEIEVTLLRATQEALANIRKHARAQAVNVTLSYMGDTVMLDIQDDGRGFDAEEQVVALPSPEGGYGLKAMAERVAQLGGYFQVESVPGEGTTLVVQFPI